MTDIDTLSSFLAATAYFRGLSEAEVASLAAQMEVVDLEDDAVLFNEGDAGDGWYLIMAGEIVIARRSDQVRPPHTLAHLEQNEGFGEMSLLEDAPRMAEARAVTPATLVRMPRDTFRTLIADNHPAATRLLHQMANTLCQRLREVTAILQDIVDNPAPAISDSSALDNLIRAVMAQN